MVKGLGAAGTDAAAAVLGPAPALLPAPTSPPFPGSDAADCDCGWLAGSCCRPRSGGSEAAASAWPAAAGPCSPEDDGSFCKHGDRGQAVHKTKLLPALSSLPLPTLHPALHPSKQSIRVFLHGRDHPHNPAPPSPCPATPPPSRRCYLQTGDVVLHVVLRVTEVVTVQSLGQLRCAHMYKRTNRQVRIDALRGAHVSVCHSVIHKYNYGVRGKTHGRAVLIRAV